MTAPLTPADCDLQDFPFMPLHVARLRDSDLANEESPEACWYAVLLWSASWHQLPAASLPDNEPVLTKLCGLGRDVKTFRKHKAGALRGFIKCEDGRLYHPTVAEVALESWRRKLEQRWRTECGRIKKRNQRDKTDLPMPTFDAFVAANYTPVDPGVPAMSRGTAGIVPEDGEECPQGQRVQEIETGTGIGISTSVSIETGAAPPDQAIAELLGLAVNVRSWRLAKRVLMERGGMTTKAAGDLVAKWVNRDKLSVEDLWDIAVATWRHGTDQPADYMGGAVRRALTKSPLMTGVVAPDADRQRVWMQEFVEHPGWWKPGDRGPAPGREGCRVDPSIQREFGVEPFKPRSAA